MEGNIIELNMPETNPIKSSHFQCNATAVNYCLLTKDFLHVMPGKCTSLIFSLNTNLLSKHPAVNPPHIPLYEQGYSQACSHDTAQRDRK